MEELRNWTAKRAGGRITIYAEGLDGRSRRITNVDTIRGGDIWEAHPIARDAKGEEYRLLPR